MTTLWRHYAKHYFLDWTTTAVSVRFCRFYEFFLLRTLSLECYTWTKPPSLISIWIIKSWDFVGEKLTLKQMNTIPPSAWVRLYVGNRFGLIATKGKVTPLPFLIDYLSPESKCLLLPLPSHRWFVSLMSNFSRTKRVQTWCTCQLSLVP